MRTSKIVTERAIWNNYLKQYEQGIITLDRLQVIAERLKSRYAAESIPRLKFCN